MHKRQKTEKPKDGGPNINVTDDKFKISANEKMTINYTYEWKPHNNQTNENPRTLTLLYECTEGKNCSKWRIMAAIGHLRENYRAGRMQQDAYEDQTWDEQGEKSNHSWSCEHGTITDSTRKLDLKFYSNYEKHVGGSSNEVLEHLEIHYKYGVSTTPRTTTTQARKTATTTCMASNVVMISSKLFLAVLSTAYFQQRM